LHTLNLGILAHVDAGKTSLTERLLFEAGTTAELGSVDAGTTRTGDVQVNLIDTPGHSDLAVCGCSRAGPRRLSGGRASDAPKAAACRRPGCSMRPGPR
jgi:predicted membrane GTPase involved in stress response